MTFSTLLTLTVTTLVHLAALLLGILTGKFLFRNSTRDFSWLGAVILVLLAFLRLF
jgi:putative Mn2+ efflux pump MntP